MTPILAVKPQDRCDSWMTIDMREEVGMVVIPLFGPDHNAGLDCWCLPDEVDGVIVHNRCH